MRNSRSRSTARIARKCSRNCSNWWLSAMRKQLIDIITASDPAMRDWSLESVCEPASLAELMSECNELERFRRRSGNLYERVRALFFLYAIHRFHLPLKDGVSNQGL